MPQDNSSETKDVLRMVEEGKVSPEEGEKLLNALDEPKSTARCPYCAEVIPGGVSVCPECRSELRGSVEAAAPAGPRSFRTLGGLSKTLIVYQLAVCGIVILSGIWGFRGAAIAQMLLAAVGFVSAVLMCKGNKSGWGLAIAWACAQIVVVIVSNIPLNRQLAHLGAHTTTNGDGLGINLVGIVLLILLIAARKDWKDTKEVSV